MGTSGWCPFNDIVAEPLRKGNHELWFESTMSYLIARDLWEVVDGNSAKPPEDEHHKKEFVRWRRKNAAALHAIQISCSSESFSYIRGVSEAKVAWHMLNQTYNLLEPEPEPEPEPDPEPEPEPEPDPEPESQEIELDVAPLNKAICENKWGDVSAFLDVHPNALTKELDSQGSTCIHMAAFLGHVDIAEKLVYLAEAGDLEKKDAEGFTPLAMVAAYTGSTPLAKLMVEKNGRLTAIETEEPRLPVVVAFSNSRNDLGRYLYFKTPLQLFTSSGDNFHHGLDLLYWCFVVGALDVALHLLQRFPNLLFATDSTDWDPIMEIAALSSSLPNKSQLVFWKRWIYDYTNVQSTSTTDFVHVDIPQGNESIKGLRLRLISYIEKLLGMKEIREMKSLHAQATEILILVCNNVTFLDKNEEKEDMVADALYRAAQEGNVEFVVKVSKASPQSIRLVSSRTGWNTFFYAVKYRQAEVFNLIYGLRDKDALAPRLAKNRYSLLHVAGEEAPSSQLNCISGPALQMQRELQWFKEVENVVPSGFKILRNGDGKRPEDIFKESHDDLRKKGEKWMWKTASSFSFVGALVVTIMFAAAFTVPGGNNQGSGYPIFLREKLFMLFIISDALSLFSSSTSVLMFLGILTSRYAEEDFLISLPTKLIIGLSTLFLSIATMMVAFSASILIMLQHAYSWSVLPIIMLASVPITLFVLLQFPLLVQMISSTYGPGIFNRNMKPWL